MTELVKGPQRIRTFEMIQYVTLALEGGIEDWPANIQDAIYEAAERKAKEVELPLAIVFAVCDKDHDSTDENKQYFIRVVLSEVVIGIDVNTQRLQ